MKLRVRYYKVTQMDHRLVFENDKLMTEAGRCRLNRSQSDEYPARTGTYAHPSFLEYNADDRATEITKVQFFKRLGTMWKTTKWSK